MKSYVECAVLEIKKSITHSGFMCISLFILKTFRPSNIVRINRDMQWSLFSYFQVYLQ